MASNADITITGKNIEVTPDVNSTPTEQLDVLASKTHNVLFEVSNIFPFDFFTDKLVIRPTKIDLIYGIFFFSDHVISMLFRDLKTVKVTTGLFFSSMTFELQGYEDNPPAIKFLNNKDALRARRMISGLMSIYQNDIKMTEIPSSELSQKAEEIGRAREI